jgi:hypothetical protein
LPPGEADNSIPLDAEATALAWTPAGGLLAVGDRSGTVSVHRWADRTKSEASWFESPRDGKTGREEPS